MEISKLADYQRSGFISRIFQNPMQGTAPEMTLLENFRLAALRGGNRRLRTGLNADFRKQVAEEVSRLNMGLEERLEQKMGSFSGGQRQALSLLMATRGETSVLLMDEPTAALDPASAALVFNLACSIVKEKAITCLMVTHDLKHCLQAGTRLIQFAEGRIRRDLSGAEKAQLGFAELAAWFA
ncbi:MAG: ATP-binding cassette domain-containing protein, partial [Bacteroidia bacterium]|nr:ATP-binding cassette domain-containing protein [Bacteroidia bacterium]